MAKKLDFPEHILWLDLETSGSDQETCTIVEVGAVLTGTDLKEIARFSTVVGSFSEEEMSAWPEVVQNMHKTSGLWNDLLIASNPDITEAQDLLMAWLLSYHPSKTHVALAGSGVGHFDRRFIDKYWPTFSKRLTYWPLDIGVPRRFFQLYDFPWIDDVKTHRALDDALHHLNEAKYLRQVITFLKLALRTGEYESEKVEGNGHKELEPFRPDDWVWD